MRPIGVESRSILPWYVPKGRRVSIADISSVGNPFHLSTLTSKSKLSTFSTTSPPQYHYLRRYMSRPQTINGKASSRIVYTQIEGIWRTPANRVHNRVILWGIESLGGWNFSTWEVKFTYMRIDWDNSRPITAAVHHLHSGMVYDGSLKKFFACLQQILVI